MGEDFPDYHGFNMGMHLSETQQALAPTEAEIFEECNRVCQHCSHYHAMCYNSQHGLCRESSAKVVAWNETCELFNEKKTVNIKDENDAED